MAQGNGGVRCERLLANMSEKRVLIPAKRKSEQIAFFLWQYDFKFQVGHITATLRSKKNGVRALAAPVCQTTFKQNMLVLWPTFVAAIVGGRAH